VVLAFLPGSPTSHRHAFLLGSLLRGVGGGLFCLVLPLPLGLNVHPRSRVDLTMLHFGHFTL
jgi:hypothetical protein